MANRRARFGKRDRRVLVRLSWILASATIAMSTCAASVDAGPAGATEPTYYIALGDSVAVGEQPGGELEQGYVEHVASRLIHRFPGLEVRNLACSGETSWGVQNGYASPEELLEGRPIGCQDPEGYEQAYPNGDDYTQVAEAVWMLRQHGGAVKLVTITVGANDVLRCLATGPEPCDLDASRDGMNQVREQLPAILSELDEARVPATKVVGTIYHNPFRSPLGEPDPPAKRAVDELNAVLIDVYGKAGVPVVRADFLTPDYESGCALTWWCSRANYHPNDKGYRAIGDLFLEKLKR